MKVTKGLKSSKFTKRLNSMRVDHKRVMKVTKGLNSMKVTKAEVTKGLNLKDKLNKSTKGLNFIKITKTDVVVQHCHNYYMYILPS